MANEDPNGELGVLLNGELHIVAGIASVSFKFLQYMLALRRSGRLNESAYTDLKKFQSDTNGEYTVFNIPTQDPDKIAAFQKYLKDAGVAFCELPDLNVRDGIVQIAVRNRDVAKWQYVQDEFIMSRLEGGQFSLKELSAMTGGRYSIVSVNVGDGTLEIAKTAEDIRDFLGKCMEDETLLKQIPSILKGDSDRVHELLQNALLKDSEQLKELQEFLENVAGVSDPSLELQGNMVDVSDLSLEHQANVSDTSDPSQKPQANVADAPDSSPELQKNMTGSSVPSLQLQAQELAAQIRETLDHTWQLRGLVRCMDENKVNYSVLPDLRYADGKTQFAFVPADQGKFKQSIRDFEKHMADRKAKESGHPLEENDIPHLDISGMDYEGYRETSEVKLHEYLKNLDPKTREDIEKVLREHKDKASVKTENFSYALEQDQQAKDLDRADTNIQVVGGKKNVQAANREQSVSPVQSAYERKPDFSEHRMSAEQSGSTRHHVYRVAESGPNSGTIAGTATENVPAATSTTGARSTPPPEKLDIYHQYASDSTFEEFLLPPGTYRDFKEEYNMCFIHLKESEEYIACIAFAPDEAGVRCFVDPEREYGMFKFEFGKLSRCTDKIMGRELISELGRTVTAPLIPKGPKA